MTGFPQGPRGSRNLIIALVVVAGILAVGLVAGRVLDHGAAAADARGAFYASWWKWVGRTLATGRIAPYAPGALEKPVEGAAGAFLLAAVAAGLALLSVPRRSRQLLAVAGVTFTEIRRGEALWLALAAGLGLAAGTPFLDYEGGPAERLRVILSASLGAAALVGTVLAVGLAALAFSREAETSSIYVIATKPVPRWAVFWGKLCGVGLALAVALAAMGLGTSAGARLAMAGEARKGDPSANSGTAKPGPSPAWLNLNFRRDLFPKSSAEAPRIHRLSRGQVQEYALDVPPGEAVGGWLVLRLHGRPQNPTLRAARVRLEIGGDKREVFALRERPAEVVLPASAAADGRLRVTVTPLPDEQGAVEPIDLDRRGGVSLAISGDSLETTLAKSLGMIWLELMVIAAVTLAASASLSFPVAAVAGLSTAAFGQLSGLAVNLLREAVAIGAASGEAPAHAAGGLDQALRTLAAGLLSLLPDFERTSPGDFLAWGNVIPWSFIAAAVLGLLVLRAVPMALVGALAFSRREVGA